MAALFAFWCFRTKFLPPEILVAEGPGAGTEPAVVVTCPELGRADLVNVPDYRLGCDLADWLAARGIESCRVVAVSSGRKASFDGLDAFAAQIPVLDVCFVRWEVEKVILFREAVTRKKSMITYRLLNL